jgi:hypothetical protein
LSYKGHSTIYSAPSQGEYDYERHDCRYESEGDLFHDWTVLIHYYLAQDVTVAVRLFG